MISLTPGLSVGVLAFSRGAGQVIGCAMAALMFLLVFPRSAATACRQHLADMVGHLQRTVELMESALRAGKNIRGIGVLSKGGKNERDVWSSAGHIIHFQGL